MRRTTTYSTAPQAVFENRQDAGRRLAAELGEYNNRSVVVLAIPNGGVPVAIEVADTLKADLDLVISRKIPAPLNPEAGFGAIADDGTVILNEEAVKRIGLSRQQIEYEASKVRADIKQRSILYRGDRPLVRVSGRVVIIIDDGLASGFTMMAAVESVRHRRPKETMVAVPCASALAVKQLEKVTDKVVTCTMGFMPKFYVSDFYRYWYDVSDDEVVRQLAEWRRRRLWRD
ncbi:MAG TPA: phosphoribosyl transferase [Dehalococcoidia bacterium]|nr:phosphoribosyl transferase [Dehalococcoidia bacterium]